MFTYCCFKHQAYPFCGLRFMCLLCRHPRAASAGGPHHGGVREDGGHELLGKDQLPIGTPPPALGVGEGGCRMDRRGQRDGEGAD